MLTLQETLTAIKSLDTDASVIASACAKILKPEDERSYNDYPDLAKAIFLDYKDKARDGADLMLAFVHGAAIVGAMVVTPGNETKLLDKLHEILTSSFMRACVGRLDEFLKNDPDKAQLMLQSIVDSVFDKAKSKG